ncbi:MAG TPA: LLM class flavin-dependent oxidoreductase [Chloroflexota bacterium]
MPADAPRYGLGVSNCRSASNVVAAVSEAETLGAEVAFIAEDVNCRDAFQLCALSASETNRIRLSTGVVNPFTRNPTSLAMAVATLDEVSAGRAQLGVGSSSPSLIEGQMGIDSRGPVTVMRETTEIVRMLLSGQVVTYTGERFRYREAVLQVQPVQASVPIYFAAMGPQMLRLAGALADGVLLNVGASTDYVRWAVRHVEEGAVSAGRDPRDITIAAWLTVYLDDERAGAAKRAREWLATMLSVPRQGELLLKHSGLDTSVLDRIRTHYRAYPHGGDLEAAAAHVPDEFVQQLTLIGDVAHVRERLQEYSQSGVQLAVMAISALRAVMS